MATRVTMRDKLTYSLAVGILIGFFIFFGIAFFEGVVLNDENNYDGIKEVSSGLGALIGAVVGYYFRHQPVNSAMERVQEETRKSTRAKITAARTSNFPHLANQQVELLKKQLKVKDQAIQNKEKIIQHLIKKTANQ